MTNELRFKATLALIDKMAADIETLRKQNEKLIKVVEAAKALKPLQPSEVKLGGQLCLGFDELRVALEEFGEE